MKRQTLQELLAEIEENRKSNYNMMPYLISGLIIAGVAIKMLMIFG